ncbi:hypothetical protein JTE90_008142 [Oedothorax gibbosus]|uniref:Uncharacterized protein n=1 Tax=Oedothorax gibbosus TaxID=931172 RepID=A0AAV6TCZ5_9ARAC|nr:hypothetical protein JTE90_008142 [Oedothorax gibbosus]
MPPSVPLIIPRVRKPQNITEVYSTYSMHHCSGVTPALKHLLIYFKVNLRQPRQPVRSSGKRGWGLVQNGQLPPLGGPPD